MTSVGNPQINTAALASELTQLEYYSAAELAAMLQQRQITSAELLECFIERVESYNHKINAVVATDYKRAREQAKAADAAIAKGEIWGPLHGLPMTVKDTFETTSMPTTSGFRKLENHRAPKDADVVERLTAAGAIIFGKTNVPELAMDLQTYNKVYGTTNNPWHLNHTPGGSSGGSAAALASGFTPLEVGSDIGGSIRIPANYCGLFGHKPSFGVVPMRGHIPGVPGQLSSVDLPVAGPLARTAEDLAMAMDILVQPDMFERKGAKIQLPEARHKKLQDFKVACWIDEAIAPIDNNVRRVLFNYIEKLRSAGVDVNVNARPTIEFQQSLNMYLQLLGSAISGSFDDFQHMGIRSAANLSKFAEKYLLVKNHALYNLLQGVGISHRNWMKLNEARYKVRQKWEEFFQSYDVLLAPVTPTAAIPHQQEGNLVSRRIQVNGESRAYLESLFWIHQASAGYLPATVAPAGRTDAGLPVGIQIMGAYMEDKTTIEFAGLAAEVAGGFEWPGL